MLCYAGANRPLWIIKTESFSEVKPTKAAIAGFTSKNRNLKCMKFIWVRVTNSIFFSDGYADQFGGNEGKKMMTKRFKEILLSNCNFFMNQQKKNIGMAYDTWKGSNEQVEDVLVIGVLIELIYYHTHHHCSLLPFQVS